MKMYCCSCAKQVVNYPTDPNDKLITSDPVILMGFGKVSCIHCSRELVENGLYPEERIEIL
jgi:hypothetical protein